MPFNRGILGKYASTDSISGLVTAKEQFTLAAGGFYPRFVVPLLSSTILNSNYTSLLVKAEGDSGTNTSITDSSTNSHTITVTGDTQATSFSPYRHGGYSVYTGAADTDYVKLNASTNYNFDDNGWQLEGWIHPEVFDGGAGSVFEFYTDDNNFFRLFQLNAPGLNLLGKIAGSEYVNLGTTNGIRIPTNEWSHFAVTWDGSKFRVYLNGVLEEESGTISTDLTSTLGSQPLYLMQDYVSIDRYIQGYIHDVRLQTGSSAVTYTGSSHTLPTSSLTTDSNTKFHLAALPYAGDKKSGTVTFAGNTSVEPYAPYDYSSYDASSHGASVYFDGTGDYLSLSDDASLQMGSGDFTIEAWVYVNAHKNSNYIYSYSYPYQFTIDANGNLECYFNDTDNFTSYITVQGSTAIPTSTWTHVAVVRNGNTFTQFVNGIQDGTATSSATLATPSTYDPIIGDWGGGSYSFDGYIQDLRIIKGSAVYTANFTPPTAPLTAISGTSLLTCNGAPNVYDASQSAGELTLYGDAASSTTQTKFASSSVYFDGNGDYVTTPASDLYTYGTGDFSIEAWVYIAVNPSNYAYIVGQGAVVASNASFGIYIQSGVFKVYNNGVVITGTTSYSLNTWYHIALVRNSGILSLFLNGALEGSATNTNNITTGTTMGPTIGRWAEVGDAGYFNGYIEDFRITKGLSRYPFIPAKETFSAVSGTSLLTAHAATITDGSTNSYTITTNGDAAVSTFAPRSGMYSVEFDGNGDSLTVPSAAAAFGTSDFTVEFWVYMNDVTSDISFFGRGVSLGNYDFFIQYRPTVSNNLRVNTQLNTYSPYDFAWTPSKNVWYNIAISRSGTDLRAFVDGTQIGSTETDSNDISTSITASIGYNAQNSQQYLNGYISNFRIVKGTALYTNSFTPPTEALT